MSDPSGRSTSSIDPVTARDLRLTAARLVEFAAAIERCSVMTLADRAVQSRWGTAQAGLCERMLRRHLHQLHRSAEELRTTAHHRRERADDLDGSAAA